MKYLIFVLLVSLLNGVNIPVTIQEDVYNDYINFLSGRNPLEISNYDGAYSRRDVVEVVMLEQALYLGGLRDFEFEFIMTNAEGRDYALLKSGKALIRGTAMWAYDYPSLEAYLYRTIDVVEEGKFEAGFYTEENRVEVLKEKEIEEIFELKVVSSKSWTVDWLTLEKLKFENRVDTAKWENMVNLVANSRADALLAPFQSNEDMSFEAYGFTFVPIKGVKIALADPRIFAVSKKHPMGQIVYESLNKGLKIMKERGIIEKIYIESGFYNQKVKDWQLINDYVE